MSHSLTNRIDPPYVHEIDECDGCHLEGEHKNPLELCDVCEGCRANLEEKAKHAAFEFSFTPDDVDTARDWARANKYRYDSVEHLLLDAMRSKVISTDKWQAI